MSFDSLKLAGQLTLQGMNHDWKFLYAGNATINGKETTMELVLPVTLSEFMDLSNNHIISIRFQGETIAFVCDLSFLKNSN